MHFEGLHKDIGTQNFKGLFPVQSICNESKCAGTVMESYPYYYITLLSLLHKFMGILSQTITA